MHVALAGPCFAQDLAEMWDRRSAAHMAVVRGPRAVPVSQLARSLVAEGHQVTIVSLTRDEPGEIEEFAGEGIRLVELGPRRRPRDYLADLYRSERAAVAEILRDSGADIVHAHWTYEYALAAQDSRCAHVTTAHDSPSTVLRRMPDAYRLARLAVAGLAGRRTQHLSVVSPYLASRWRTQMRYRRPIRVIPNGIPQDVAGLSRAPGRDPVILDIGNDTRLKNLRSLIRALPLVRRDLPKATLRLVGPGTQAGGDLAQWAASQGLDHHVRFLGEFDRGQILEEYRRVWVLAHASLEEACPMVLLEALGAGLPALGGARSGGVPYVLEWGRRGALTDVADPARFAEAITGTLKRGPLAAVGGSDYLDRFDPQHVAGQYVSWYADILNANRL